MLSLSTTPLVAAGDIGHLGSVQAAEPALPSLQAAEPALPRTNSFEIVEALLIGIYHLWELLKEITLLFTFSSLP